MNQGVKASLSVYTHLLVQRIRQKLENDNIVDSFENLCALAEVSSLAHNMWALCVSETKSLWKIYGRAWKCLLFTPGQLQKCDAVISSYLLNEDDTEAEIRHPWDKLLMLVVSDLVSDLDLSLEGVVRLFKLRDKAMRAKGLTSLQAMKEIEKLKDALCHLDLIGTRPRSLCSDVLPLLKLELEEEEMLALPLKSVLNAWELLAFEMQIADKTPDTHIDTEDESSASQVPLNDCTWHFVSE
eukprot:Blabericola_migrator_1__7251@NODE_3682_length_1580_cov_58_645737_g2284_i0_p1_GENE_NODE_3682_length_1580_cov_58_645737_g2284_i0NODE_3682_length_1580_cov_58_645737_g2284_i0_p1_ORF_typecomplete_len241_score45_57_NODE_3682_length_1580_cov_58_645737_g2284_i05711293